MLQVKAPSWLQVTPWINYKKQNHTGTLLTNALWSTIPQQKLKVTFNIDICSSIK